MRWRFLQNEAACCAACVTRSMADPPPRLLAMLSGSSYAANADVSWALACTSEAQVPVISFSSFQLESNFVSVCSAC